MHVCEEEDKEEGIKGGLKRRIRRAYSVVDSTLNLLFDGIQHLLERIGGVAFA